ncbi:HMG-box [Phlegmacium glaucopus]|nr:HMG-box [Phlegmacium glaucopus]
MPTESSKFELHRTQLASSLSAVAESMRNCAQIADIFAKIVQDSEYSPETAETIHGITQVEPTTKGKRKAALSPEDGEGSKKRKRPIKPKDPNAPKRPASSYILFQNEVRKELKERHPELSNADLLSLISEQWKSMSDEQKETYNQAMKTAKAQYSEDKKAYDNRTPEQVDAANAAAAAANSLKKTPVKPRGPKATATPAPVTIEARPPPPAEALSTDTSDDDDSEVDEAAQVKQTALDTSSEEDDEEDDEVAVPEPPPKKKRGASAQPAVPKEKGKKGSKAR